MKISYRLALDIGTASCGLIAVSLDSRGEPAEIAHHGLYIFSEPLLPPKAGGIGEPKKAARRNARLARRVIDRRARRLKRIALLSRLLGIDHSNVTPDDGQHIHALRAKAATEPLEIEDLLRVLLKLAKRRGYKGSFKVRKEKDEGVVEPGINQLRQHIADAGCNTLGQYLSKRFDAGDTLKLKEAGLYAHRDMLEAEFEEIWTEQAKHHPLLSESRPDPLDEHKRLRSIRDQFHGAIFYQRPLKSVAPMVGNCALEPSLPRAPMAQPAMQAFRIEKQLADLRWGMRRNAPGLTAEQKTLIRKLLNDPGKLTKEGKLSFKKIYEALEAEGLRPDYPRSLNMERSSREDLTGNRTLRVFKDIVLLDEWRALDEITQLRVINFLADLGSPEQVDQLDWHDRYTKTARVKNPKSGKWEEKHVRRDLDHKLVEFINRMVDTKKFDRLNKMGFETGRASYSIRALEKLAAAMREENCDEHEAIQHLYPPPEATGELLPQLLPHPPTGNVVVDVALRQVRRAVNDALTRLGQPPAEIVIELSRDMALGLKARGDIERKIDKNKRQRQDAKKALESNEPPIPGTDRNVLRYILWQQQDTHCPYCGERISFGQAVDGNATHFEHILPRSLTRVGKQRNHLVLAHQSCNNAKGDRTPFEAFGHDGERWKAVEYCASVLKSNKQFAKARLLALTDYEHEILDDESIADFSERQFVETSWIGKLTAQWMKEVCTKVSVSRGLLTAHLRRIWKLETVIAEARLNAEPPLPVLDADGNKITLDDFKRFKPFWEGHNGKDHPRTDRKIDKRIDHRHHLIDALVIAQTSRSLYQRMAKHYKELAERRREGEAVRMTFSVEPPLRDVRSQALVLVREAAIRHKPDQFSSGMFFQKTAYRKAYSDDGDSRLSVRIKLEELTDNKGSIDKARKGISDIVSSHTRRVVSNEFERRIQAGESVKQALSLAIIDPQFNTPIKKVAVFQRVGRGFVDGSSAFPVKNSWYLSDGYAYVSITEEDGRIVAAESVPLISAAAQHASRTAGERRFFRGDTLRDKATGTMYIVHQILANATVRVAPVTESRSWIELGADAGATQFGARALIQLIRA
ncbi:MAG: type II CRISPR RNA-guided endonuclease Cas9 [Sterolibacterium sp.]